MIKFDWSKPGNFLKDVVLAKREAAPGERRIITERVYLNRIGSSYRFGQVDALLKIGKTIPEIAKILEIHESSVRMIINRKDQNKFL